MERKSFLKSLFGIVVAPSILSEVNFNKESISLPSVNQVPNSKQLFNDLNLIVPKYIQSLQDKYGDENYGLMISSINGIS